jgi:hypothetical protein
MTPVSFVSWMVARSTTGQGKMFTPRPKLLAGDGGPSSPAAHAAASRLVGTPSFAWMAETWWSMVRVDTTSRRAISAFDSPVATRRRISS